MASSFPLKKNTSVKIVFPIFDADGDPVTGAASDTPDTEYSLDGGSFTDCSDEIAELATNSGIYEITLTADETNGDVVCIQCKTATAGTKTTVLVFYTAAQTLDEMDTNIDDIETAVITNAAGTDIAADIIALKAETVSILADTGTTLEDRQLLIFKLLSNKLVLSDTNDNMILYDDDETTPLYTWALLDKDGSAISVDAGVPARRGHPT